MQQETLSVMPQEPAKSRIAVAFFLGVLTVFLIVKESVPEKLFQNTSFYSEGLRLVTDNFDRTVYSYYGRWVKMGVFPYGGELYIDMPQNAVAFFGLLWLFSNTEAQYFLVFSIAMLNITFCSFLIFAGLAQRVQGVGIAGMLVWFNPVMIYFFLNRFDMLVILLLLSSIWFAFKGQSIPAGVFFTLSLLTKWFPALAFIPVFIYLRQNKSVKSAWTFAASVATLLFLVLLVTFLLSGWQGLMMPYRAQTTQKNQESLFYFLHCLLPAQTWLKYPFLFLQAAPCLAIPFIPRKYDIRNLMAVLSAVILNFILFCPVNSPQWIQWFLPFLLLAVNPNWRWLSLVVLLQVLTYAYYPVIYDWQGPDTFFFILTVSVRLLLMAGVEGALILQLTRNRFQENAA